MGKPELCPWALPYVDIKVQWLILFFVNIDTALLFCAHPTGSREAVLVPARSKRLQFRILELNMIVHRCGCHQQINFASCEQMDGISECKAHALVQVYGIENFLAANMNRNYRMSLKESILPIFFNHFTSPTPSHTHTHCHPHTHTIPYTTTHTYTPP